MKSLSVSGEAGPLIRSLTIAGKAFDVTVQAQPQGGWHWLIAAPGEIVLSGEAPSEMQAMDCACRAGRALARLSAA
jgi:hypothetical protein